MRLLQCVVKESVESRVTPRSVEVSERGIFELNTVMVVRPADFRLSNLCRVEKRIAADLEGLTERPFSASQVQR